MNNFFKSHWIAITVCLVYSLLATGGAAFFVKKSAQENYAVSSKLEEQLQTAGSALEKANAETASVKESWNKEKALNEDLKKMIAEADMELDKLRITLKSITLSASKTSRSKLAKAPISAATPAVVPSPDCRPSDSQFSRNKIRALQKLQADVHRRDRELREKQKKLDDAMDSVAREKRKVTLQNSEYRWPHHADPGNK